MTTFDDGRSSTCRLPRFSALYIVLSPSFSTLTRTMADASVLKPRRREALRASKEAGACERAGKTAPI